jgi:hypothetical protein
VCELARFVSASRAPGKVIAGFLILACFGLYSSVVVPLPTRGHTGAASRVYLYDTAQERT